jgi:O-antigen/teichoic acid export membrane protein
MGALQFGDWRKASLVLIPAGIVHIGLADGLFNRWVRQYDYRIPVIDYIKSISFIAILSTLYTLATFTLGYFDSYLITFVFLSIFFYGIYSISSSYIQSHSEEKYYVLYSVSQPMILLTAVVTMIALHTIKSQYLFIAYSISFILPVILLSAKTVGGREDMHFRDLLIVRDKGLTIMAANVFLLISMNIDKLLFGLFVSGRIFGSYSLLSAIPFAASTIGYPIGLALYSRGVSKITTKRASFLISISGAIVFYGLFRIFKAKISQFYTSFDFSLLPIFLITSIFVFVMSTANFPVRRYEFPKRFAYECITSGILVATTIFFSRVFFGDNPAVYIIAFGLVFLCWILYIELYQNEK